MKILGLLRRYWRRIDLGALDAADVGAPARRSKLEKGVHLDAKRSAPPRHASAPPVRKPKPLHRSRSRLKQMSATELVDLAQKHLDIATRLDIARLLDTAKDHQAAAATIRRAELSAYPTSAWPRVGLILARSGASEDGDDLLRRYWKQIDLGTLDAAAADILARWIRASHLPVAEKIGYLESMRAAAPRDASGVPAWEPKPFYLSRPRLKQMSPAELVDLAQKHIDIATRLETARLLDTAKDHQAAAATVRRAELSAYPVSAWPHVGLILARAEQPEDGDDLLRRYWGQIDLGTLDTAGAEALVRWIKASHLTAVEKGEYLEAMRSAAPLDASGAPVWEPKPLHLSRSRLKQMSTAELVRLGNGRINIATRLEIARLLETAKDHQAAAATVRRAELSAYPTSAWPHVGLILARAEQPEDGDDLLRHHWGQIDLGTLDAAGADALVRWIKASHLRVAEKGEYLETMRSSAPCDASGAPAWEPKPLHLSRSWLTQRKAAELVAIAKGHIDIAARLEIARLLRRAKNHEAAAAAIRAVEPSAYPVSAWLRVGLILARAGNSEDGDDLLRRYWERIDLSALDIAGMDALTQWIHSSGLLAAEKSRYLEAMRSAAPRDASGAPTWEPKPLSLSRKWLRALNPAELAAIAKGHISITTRLEIARLLRRAKDHEAAAATIRAVEPSAYPFATWLQVGLILARAGQSEDGDDLLRRYWERIDLSTLDAPGLDALTLWINVSHLPVAEKSKYLEAICGILETIIAQIPLVEESEHLDALRRIVRIIATEIPLHAALFLKKLSPSKIWSPFLTDCARTLMNNWQLPDALDVVNQALAIQPSSALYTIKANVLWDMGEVDEALVNARRAVALEPYNQSADELVELLNGSADDLNIDELTMAIQGADTPIEAAVSASILLARRQRSSEAETLLINMLEGSLEVPQRCVLIRALAGLYERAERFEEAAEQYKTLILQERYVPASHVGVARCMLELNRLDEAEESMQAALKAGSNKYNPAVSNLKLAQGNLYDGFRDYRYRKFYPALHHQFGSKYLRNETNILHIDNSTNILLIMEHGPGDEIRIATFYPELQQKFLHITATCEPRLYSILQRNFPQISFLPVARSRKEFRKSDYEGKSMVCSAQIARFVNNDVIEASRNADLVCSIYDIQPDLRPHADSFPKINRLLDPLPALVAEWGRFISSRNGNSGRFKIAINWRSMLQNFVRNRNYFQISEFSLLANLPNVEFWAFQPTMAAEEFDELQRVLPNIYQPEGLDLRDDFEGMAAFLANMDLLIAPTTSNAELSAAVGTPTLILSNVRNTSWRRNEDGSDMWHHSARIIVGTPLGDRPSQMKVLMSEIKSIMNMSRPAA